MSLHDFFHRRQARILLASALTIGALLATSAYAQAANTLTVTVSGTSNCCTDTVNNGSWSLTAPASVPGGSTGAGKVSFGTFDVNMPVDLNDMVYFSYAAAQKSLTSVLYATPIIDYCMENARINSLSTNANGTDDVSFVFESMYEVNPSFKPTSSTPWSGFAWDQSKNIAATSATAPCGAA